MRPTRLSLWAGLALLLCGSAFAQVKGTLTEVRVYRGQALVTRAVPLEARAGAQEVVIGDLPEQVLPDSLYATGDENLVIRAVRYRATAVKEEPRDEVRQLDQQIQTAQDEVAKVASDLQVAEQQGQYLSKLEGFVAPTAQAEISKGVLNSEQLIGLTKFMFEQRTTLATQKVALAKSQRTAQEALAVLQRKRAELAGAVQRTAREAVLFVEATAAKASSLELNYLVGGVYWSPAYVARLNGNRDKLIVEYHGVVSQMTGEDWTGVNLTLSTSQPNMTASAPLLSPMWLALSAAGDADAALADGPAGYQNQRRELEQQLRGQNAPASKPMMPPTGGAMPGMMPGAQGPVARPQAAQPMTDDELGTNVLAAKLQNLEMAAGDEAIKATRRMKPTIAEGLAVDYPIAGKVSLASRNDQQMFRIAVLDLPAEAYYTASPLISDYVYQAVMTTNTTDTTLLPGPYNAYLDGAFAGRGNLPMVAKGEQVTLGFGTESQLRAVRDLLDKQTEIKGGNKVLTLTYSLRLQNFMAKPAKVRLWDRMPQPPNNQVTVTLVDNGQPLSTDPLYVEQEKSRGLLRWDIEIPANATGAKALSFTFKVKLEFDKQMAVGELPEQTIERMRKDIDTLKELKR